jgi:hypothetical protein
MRAAGLLLAAPLLAGLGNRPLPDSLEGDIRAYNAMMASFFRPNALVPVAVPAGQSVGDVYEYDTWVLAERVGTCFPSLQELRTGPSVLPAITRLASRHVGLALGAAGLVDLDGSVNSENTVEVRFLDVLYAETSKGELRRSLDPACENLRPVVEEKPDLAALSERRPVIIGRLLTGRKQIFIGVRDSTDMTAKVNALRAVLAATGAGAAAAAIPIEVSVAAQGRFGNRQGLVVETTQRMPIAFQPAFLTDIFLRPPPGVVQGNDTRPESRSGPEPSWAAFDPANNAEQREIFDRLVRNYTARR